MQQAAMYTALVHQQSGGDKTLQAPGTGEVQLGSLAQTLQFFQIETIRSDQGLQASGTTLHRQTTVPSVEQGHLHRYTAA
jgi:hypothetical protein